MINNNYFHETVKNWFYYYLPLFKSHNFYKTLKHLKHFLNIQPNCLNIITICKTYFKINIYVCIIIYIYLIIQKYKKKNNIIFIIIFFSFFASWNALTELLDEILISLFILILHDIILNMNTWYFFSNIVFGNFFCVFYHCKCCFSLSYISKNIVELIF